MNKYTILISIILIMSVGVNIFYFIKESDNKGVPWTENEGYELVINNKLIITNSLFIAALDSFIVAVEKKGFPGKIAYQVLLGEQMIEKTSFYLSVELDEARFRTSHPFGYFLFKGKTIFLYSAMSLLFSTPIVEDYVFTEKKNNYFNSNDSFNISNNYYDTLKKFIYQKYRNMFEEFYGLCNFYSVNESAIIKTRVWNWNSIEIPFLMENPFLTTPTSSGRKRYLEIPFSKDSIIQLTNKNEATNWP